MKAFVIPANSSEPVREVDFDQDDSWRYVRTRYNDPDEHPWIFSEVAFLTKENAPRDNVLRNSRASEYLKNHSHPFDSPENLYGDVFVLGYDTAFEKLTDLPWPRSPEDFEDLLTRIVTPPPPIRDEKKDDQLIAEWQRRRGTETPPGPGDGLQPRRDIYDLGGAPDPLSDS
jgi:hypothetical protein